MSVLTSAPSSRTASRARRRFSPSPYSHSPRSPGRGPGPPTGRSCRRSSSTRRARTAAGQHRGIDIGAELRPNRPRARDRNGDVRRDRPIVGQVRHDHDARRVRRHADASGLDRRSRRARRSPRATPPGRSGRAATRSSRSPTCISECGSPRRSRATSTRSRCCRSRDQAPAQSAPAPAPPAPAPPVATEPVTTQPVTTQPVYDAACIDCSLVDARQSRDAARPDRAGVDTARCDTTGFGAVRRGTVVRPRVSKQRRRRRQSRTPVDRQPSAIETGRAGVAAASPPHDSRHEPSAAVRAHTAARLRRRRPAP